MTTAPPTRPSSAASSRPGPNPVGGAMAGGITLDPIKVLKKYKWLLAASFIIGLVLGVVTHVALVELYPTYKSTVTYAVREPTTNIADPAGTEKVNEDALNRFMASQLQMMRSERVLQDAANDPRIQTDAPSWARTFVGDNGAFDFSEAAKHLEDNMKARVIPGTNFIQLSYAWRKKVDTTAVVKTVGEAYLADLRRAENRETGNQREALRRSINELTDGVERLQRQRERLMVENKVDTLQQQIGEAGVAIHLISDQLVNLRIQIEATIVSLDGMTAELEGPAGISYSDDLRAEVEANPIIANLKQTISGQDAEMSSLKSRFGAKHRDVLLLQARLDGYREQINSQRETLLRQTFDARLELYQRGYSQLQAQEADMLQRLETQKQRLGEMTRIAAQIEDLEREIQNLTTQKSARTEDLSNIEQLAQAEYTDRVTVYQPAIVPNEVSFPKLIIVLPLGIMLTVGLVSGVVVLREILDQRVRGPADVAVIPRTRVVGLVPHAAEDPASPAAVETAFTDSPEGVLAESFRQLRAPILKRIQQGGYSSLLVMAGLPGSGSTTVVCNLAAACAATQRKVLIIDANFRRSKIPAVFNFPEAPGLADVLAGQTPLSDAVHQTSVENLDVLTAGSRDLRVVERLDTSPMSEVLEEAGKSYSLVIIDVAPAIVSGDGVALANRVDASILVVKALAEKRGLVARIKNELCDARAEFLGVVVNAVRSSAGGYFKQNIKATHEYQQDVA